MTEAKMMPQKDQSCIGYIYTKNFEDLIIRVIDSEAVYVVWSAERSGINANPSIFSDFKKFHNCIKAKDIKKFVKNIPKIVGKSLKAVIFEIFDLSNVPGYDGNAALCYDFKNAFDSLNVPYCFISCFQRYFSTMVASASNEINIEAMDKIIALYFSNEDNAIGLLKFSNSGYLMCDINMKMDTDGESMDVVDVHVIAKKHKLKNIILCQNNQESVDAVNDYKNDLMQNENLILLEESYHGYIAKFMEEMGKWILDKSCSKYYVHPKILLKYEILDSSNNVLLSVDLGEALPLIKSCTVSKDVISVTEVHYDSRLSKILEKTKSNHHELNQTLYGHKITISIDANYFYKFEIQALTKMDSFLLTVNENISKLKIPIIGLWDNSSVICLYNDETNEYHFAKRWNGRNGTELIIDFSTEKPIYCKHATFDKMAASDYMVYDIIKIMSMPATEIKVEETWKFKITKDEENPVLLDFNTFEGMKLAPPPFLMALLIKKHRKIIKNEIGGEKPEKIGFCILDEKYSIEEKERIKNGLKEACELLKIGFEFIDV